MGRCGEEEEEGGEVRSDEWVGRGQWGGGDFFVSEREVGGGGGIEGVF